ncbi:MAG: alpha/beta hydrolase [Rhizobiaceae bacterium]
MAGDIHQDFFYDASDGLRLHARIYEGTSDPVVCLPGLTRNARDFHELALHLSGPAGGGHRVVVFDYRGRGQSASDPDWKKYDVRVEAADVLTGLDALGIARAHVIGTSRGGLVMHVLAATRAALFLSAVLNDIGPVVEAQGLLDIRAYLEKAARPRSFAEAAAAQRAVHGAAFPALADADWDRLARALHRDEGGVPVADFDPALLNVLIAFDPAKPAPDLWPLFDRLAGLPLMVIRGENSSLLSAETLAEMARRHPACETITATGQGHPPMLETGDLPQRIAAFLDRAATAAS